MKKAHPPKHIPLNVIDRQFLVPETDDFTNGSYLPMTVTAAIRPRIMPSVASLQNAIIQVDTEFPQYRLCYTLDLVTPRWVRVPDENRIEYLKNRVQKSEVDTVEEHLTYYIRYNLFPLEEPLKIFICNDSLCFHFYHAFGDGRFCTQIVASILTALFKPESFEQTDNPFFIPLREVAMSNFPQTMKVIGHVVKQAGKKATNYISGLSTPSIVVDPTKNSVYQATISGTKMDAAYVEIPPDKMKQIKSIVSSLSTTPQISLNTYWQIFFAFRMNEMGLVNWPIELTALIDLRRYMKGPKRFYPGNCINNIRLTINKASFVNACVDYQSQLEKRINNAHPLADMFITQLLALAGDTAFRQANRHFYLKVSPQERRFYAFTNAGRLDNVFQPIRDYIFPDIRFVTPIMGAAPLVILFTSFNNYGLFTATYKPDIISKEDVLRIMDFS